MRSAERRAEEPRAVLIIAGGRGTRFWPASRADRPKPLFKLQGKTSLIVDTVRRHQPLVARSRIFVLVPREHQRLFATELRRIIPKQNLIVEPEGRGTAVAIAYGAGIVRRRLGESMLAVMPADHYVTPADGFRATLADAFRLARAHQSIVVIGVTPDRVDAGYGYQKIGAALDGGYRVARFVEKPPLRAAERMVRSGNFLWNAGMFVMSTRTLAAELSAHCAGLGRAMEQFATIPARRLPALYRKLRFDAFDREVIEKSSRVIGVRARFEWHDVGSWEGLWQALRGSGHSVVQGNVMALDSQGVLARSEGRLMVLLGVEEIVAIDTGDALLIAKRSRSQEVRKVIEELERRGMHRYL